MNWYIFASVGLGGLVATAVYSAYRFGQVDGRKKGLCDARSASSNSLINEYNRGWADATVLNEENSEGSRDAAREHGRLMGWRAGVAHQKRIHAKRAARRDGKGRFKKEGGA